MVSREKSSVSLAFPRIESGVLISSLHCHRHKRADCSLSMETSDACVLLLHLCVQTLRAKDEVPHGHMAQCGDAQDPGMTTAILMDILLQGCLCRVSSVFAKGNASRFMPLWVNLS
jgi:hypothetical protein